MAILLPPLTSDSSAPPVPAAALARGAVDKNMLMKLLVAQLRNQDPMKPTAKRKDSNSNGYSPPSVDVRQQRTARTGGGARPRRSGQEHVHETSRSATAEPGPDEADSKAKGQQFEWLFSSLR